MKIVERSSLRGVFRLNVYRNGELIDTYEDNNLIVSAAKVSLAALLSGDGASKIVTKIAFGTNGTAPASSDTAITGAYTKNVVGHSYPATGQVEFSWNLLTGEANGMQIKEFGLISEDGTLFARKVREEAIPKADDISIEGQWLIIF